MHRIPADLSLRSVTGVDGFDARTLYLLLQLRERVFVVEQDCPYLELDGRDLEAGTTQLWLEAGDGSIAATLRVLDDDHVEAGLRRIGRVVTAPEQRGRGLAALLMAAALEGCGDAPVVLDAQSHLAHWYARFGFIPDGPEFIEDSIPHTPMRRG